jgi:hypothetical protein
MDWPHKLRIARATAPGGGSQSDDGVWSDNAGQDDDTVVYDSLADVQDAGKTLERDNLGSPSNPSTAIAFLKDEKKIKDIKVGDVAEITWEDGTKDKATVIRIRRIDGALALKNV